MCARCGDRPRAPRRRGERGFTMIEVMIALLLTAVAVMGVLGVYMVQARASSASRHSSEAAFLAQDQLEQLRTQVAVAATGSDANVNERGLASGIFTRSWSTTLGPGYVDIAVTVTWSEDGVARRFVLRGRRAT
ncbi:MAG TPA: prepilin-type N-terminal cleavage/methylation domain-containing protein [Kofleriaceae bacterium]|nr:prepilin-type N-terminal cleavage/methylation domain-containing protein [Kofleriaceae bacterium]